MEKGSISFFEIKQCGFYRSKEKELELVEGSLEETAAAFYNWVKDREFKQTIPWDTSKHPKRPQIYCKSIAQDASTKDTLLVLWKRFGDDSGRVSGIAPDAKVGNDTSDSIKIDPKVKGQSAYLGQPMYYWFIPEFNVIATINFPHACASTKEVCDYIKRCVDYRIDNPLKATHEEESTNQNDNTPIIKKFVTYKHPDSDTLMRFKFFVSTKELDSERANAIRLSRKITHIVVRDTISTEKEDQKDALFKILDRVKGKKKFSKQIEITEEATLSESEVSDMLKIYNDEYNPLDKWNNVGFKEKDNNTTRWLNSYVSRESIMMHPLADGQNYYSADIVLDELTKIRSDLVLQLFESSDTSVPEIMLVSENIVGG